MTGLSNYTADNELNYLTGQIGQPSLPTAWLALFTAVGTDAGTGFTEVSGAGYGRVQCSGTLTTNGTTTSAGGTIHINSLIPSWVQVGMSVLDISGGTVITAGTTIASIGVNTFNLSVPPTGTVGNGDMLALSAFAPATGTAPSTDTTGAVITFNQATGNWGTVVSWGLYDAQTAGDLLLWDFLGNFSWLPASVSSVQGGNGAVFTTHAHGYSNNDPIVCTNEYGGTFPTVTAGTLTSYTVNYVANVATDTFTLVTQPAGTNVINTTSTGAVLERKITQQSIPQNVTASFAAASFTLSAA
jgi:hypothetical protein